MSYRPLGGMCGNQNGMPFQQGTKPVQVKTVLLSNFGSPGYNTNVGKSADQLQCGGITNFKNAYSVQMNPYASTMCKQ
jgi:hypothetical protein